MNALLHRLQKIILLILFIGLPTHLLAEDSYNAVSINFKSGEHVYFLFSTYPCMSFDDNSCYVKTSETNTEYSLADIDNVTLTDYMQGGVTDAYVEGNKKITVDFTDPTFIKINGIIRGEEIRVFSLNGVKLFSLFSDNDEIIMIPTNKFENNTIYVIFTSQYSFKYYKK